MLRRECRKWAIRVAREAKAINDIEKRLSVLKGIIFSSFILIMACLQTCVINIFELISVHPIQCGTANHVRLKTDYLLFRRFQIVDNEDIFFSISISYIIRENMTGATEKFVARHLEPRRVSRGGGGARGGAGARAAQDQDQQGGSLLYL